LLENSRFHPEEEKNDPEFAGQLAQGFDLYINNDFAVCHRSHASVLAITKILPSYAGFLVEEETAKLRDVINSPKDGKTLIIGGAKASTKIPVIKNFLNILLGKFLSPIQVPHNHGWFLANLLYIFINITHISWGPFTEDPGKNSGRRLIGSSGL